MIEFLTALAAIIVIFVLAIVVNRNLVYLTAITLVAVILAILDYSTPDSRYFAIVCMIILTVLAVKFYEHYRE
jgi:hypothetical protein